MDDIKCCECMANHCMVCILQGDTEQAHQLMHKAIDMGRDPAHAFTCTLAGLVTVLKNMLADYDPMTGDLFTNFCGVLKKENRKCDDVNE